LPQHPVEPGEHPILRNYSIAGLLRRLAPRKGASNLKYNIFPIKMKYIEPEWAKRYA